MELQEVLDCLVRWISGFVVTLQERVLCTPTKWDKKENKNQPIMLPELKEADWANQLP